MFYFIILNLTVSSNPNPDMTQNNSSQIFKSNKEIIKCKTHSIARIDIDLEEECDADGLSDVPDYSNTYISNETVTSVMLIHSLDVIQIKY